MIKKMRRFTASFILNQQDADKDHLEIYLKTN